MADGRHCPVPHHAHLHRTHVLLRHVAGGTAVAAIVASALAWWSLRRLFRRELKVSWRSSKAA